MGGMGSPVSSIRNLGPASEREFARIGIETAEQLRALGADAAYSKLIESGMRPHFIGYYAMVMGLQGRPWNDCKGSEKSDLRKRFDEICAAAKKTGRPEMEAALDLIGLGNRRQPTSSRPEKK